VRGSGYDDQREAHRQIYAGYEVIEYAFMGADPGAAGVTVLRGSPPRY